MGSDNLTITEIRKWAKAFHERRGVWPGRDSGPVYEAPEITWSTIDRCLKRGGNGLKGRASLSALLRAAGAEIFYGPHKRLLSTRHILEWADLHHMRTGQWPHREAGRVREAPDTTWGTIDRHIRRGEHNAGAPCTLNQLLREHRGVWDSRGNARLTLKLILKWADAHYARTGHWPVTLSGPVHGVRNEKWVNIDMAMRNGRRSIGRKISLSQLLRRERGTSYQPNLAPLTVKQIVSWANAHCKRTGKWPSRKSGAVYGEPGTKWSVIDSHLCHGGRGLAGGSSLSRLLIEHCGKRSSRLLPKLNVDEILAWADAHHQRTGQWPRKDSSPIPEAPGDTWKTIDACLTHGNRGLVGGLSLPRLLAGQRGVPNMHDLPPLCVGDIFAWARAHHERTGTWPGRNSGPVIGGGAPTWAGVDSALKVGSRGLPAGSSLAKLLAGARAGPAQNQGGDYPV